MDLISEIVARAKANRQRIVLPEGTEERTLKAADQVLADGVAAQFSLQSTNDFHWTDPRDVDAHAGS